MDQTEDSRVPNSESHERQELTLLNNTDPNPIIIRQCLPCIAHELGARTVLLALYLLCPISTRIRHGNTSILPVREASSGPEKLSDVFAQGHTTHPLFPRQCHFSGAAETRA